jgi:hypothetical protein
VDVIATPWQATAGASPRRAGVFAYGNPYSFFGQPFEQLETI